MGTGASAAKRNAKRKAAEAYYKALTEAKRVDPLKRQDTRSASAVRDELEEAGAETRRLARQSDRMARTMNQSRDEFNEKVERYNDRYDRLKEQMKGRPIGKYDGVSSNLVGKDDKRKSEIDAEINKLRAEEAAFQKANPQRPGAVAFGMKPKAAPLTEEQRTRAERIQELSQGKAYLDRTSKWVGNSYRHLGNLKSAYGEMASLAKELQGYKPKGLISQRQQEEQMREALSKPSQRATVAGVLLGQNDPTRSQFANIRTGVQGAEFDPENMVIDKSSAAYKLNAMAPQYQALAEKLQGSVKRDAERAAMNKVKQPVEMLAGSDVIDPNANPATQELLS